MPGAVDIAAQIAAAADCLVAHGHSDVARALLRCIGGETFEAAIGAHPGWQAAARVRARDAALAALARQIAAPSIKALADRTAAIVCRYHASAWPADRDAGRRPEGLNGAAFDFLRTSRPLGSERLRQLLASVPGNETGCDYQTEAA